MENPIAKYGRLEVWKSGGKKRKSPPRRGFLFNPAKCGIIVCLSEQ
jgi:hypothetical protein